MIKGKLNGRTVDVEARPEMARIIVEKTARSKDAIAASALTKIGTAFGNEVNQHWLESSFKEVLGKTFKCAPIVMPNSFSYENFWLHIQVWRKPNEAGQPEIKSVNASLVLTVQFNTDQRKELSSTTNSADLFAVFKKATGVSILPEYSEELDRAIFPF